MFTAARSMRQAAAADALPRVGGLKQLHDFGFLPRRGQVLMIAGQPGAGKSAFGMWYAEETGLRVLYFSADQDAHTSITRLAASRSGYTVDSVSSALENNGGAFFEGFLSDSRIQFCFDSAPTLGDMSDEIAAYVELWDSYPELIIIDNLMNIEGENESDFAGLKLVIRELHRMARETKAGVVVIHHTREEGDSSSPQPRSAIQGKVSQLPERILTVSLDPNDLCFKFAPVKNRGGKSDGSGKTFFRLKAVPARATFEPWVSSYYGGYGA